MRPAIPDGLQESSRGVGPVRDAIDVRHPNFASWLRDCGLGSGPVSAVVPLAGGTQNVMYAFRFGGRDFVIRAGPEHPRLGSDAAIRREVRVLSALGDTGVPHPRIVAAVNETIDAVGPPAYVMEYVVGFNPGVELPEPYRSNRGLRYRSGRAVVDALAQVHAVDPESIGLQDLGRPEGFLARQVPRWLHELERYSELPGYTHPQLPGIEELGEWLGENRPDQGEPALVHGDIHLANLILTPTSGKVAALVDWEMSTLGDPLLDLGWLVVMWPHGEGPQVLETPIGLAGGLPRPEELISFYACNSDRDLSAVEWYVELARFKLAILLEGTYARSLSGLASPVHGERLHSAALLLLAKSRR